MWIERGHGDVSTQPTDRTRIKRHPERATYDRAAVEAILDEALMCHIGFVVDGQPYVIPTIHARVGDHVYLHGAAASRMLETLGGGAPVCLTATLLDGLVLARCAFSHSMNFRSVVVLGVPTEVTDEAEKLRALEAIVEHVVPGRWRDARHPTEIEMRSTRVVRMPLDEVSAKIRTGPPKDQADDLGLDVWAGVIPLSVVPGRPAADPALRAGIAVPEYVEHYRVEGRRRRGS